MTDFDVEYESIYSTTVRPISYKSNRQKSIKKQQTQTIIFKVAKHTGDYFNVCCSSLDTLQNLYSKIAQNSLRILLHAYFSTHASIGKLG